MNGRYPDYKTYRALYARYYDRGMSKLLQLLEPLNEMDVLDLCGGDGRLTLKALEQGAHSVVLVDAESAMVPTALWQHPKVRVEINPVRPALATLMGRYDQFDRIVCQQAINYWLDDAMVVAVRTLLKPGGIFAFNTFHQKPPEKPRVLEYEHRGHAFVEVSWLEDEIVHHVQVREGLPPHTTTFRWLSPERLREMLTPRFDVNESVEGKTTLVRCVKL